jgi:multidrug efflux pump subunit AcrA (membrane-fusion protein)
MGRSADQIIVGVCALALAASCGRPTAPPVAEAASPLPVPVEETAKREIRLTGALEAVRSTKIVVPTIYGSGGQQTLTRLVASGVRVKAGDIIAEFDPTQQLDSARDAQARYDDLGHQVEQKVAQNRADAESREASLRQAQAALDKALLELQKGPILSEITRLENEVKVDIARKHVASLKESISARGRADAAALRLLELQRDRQKIALERWQNNIALLQVRAPLAGMVALQVLYRNNTITHPQEGDQLYRGQPLVSIFDPSEMLVRCAVGEPDGTALGAGARARVYLDAYPDLVLPAHFEFASPVAASNLGSPIKTFTAIFKLDRTDPRLMPDLSAAVVLEPSGAGAK